MASVVLSFGGKDIKVYELTKPATVVGRDPGADIVIDNLGVSRSHCQFLRRGAGFVLQDMNSSNGTYVNGQKIGEHNLNHDDHVVVGKYTLTFKNEQQQAPAGAAVHEKIVPDSLNTYMMDSDKIRQKMEEMRRSEQTKAPPAAEPTQQAAAGGAPAPAAPAPPPTKTAAPAASRSEQSDRHPRIVMGTGAHSGISASTVKRYLYFSLAVNVLLVIALAVLLFLFYTQQPS